MTLKMPMTVRSSFHPIAEWTVADVARAIGADVSSQSSEQPVAGISTDTRTLRRAELFLAIKGESFDGHDYCAAAVESGATGVIVQRDFPHEFDDRAAVLRVDDPLRAYGELARAQREAWGGRALAISGSAGKTTTRRLLARSLARHLNVLEPVRNYNNLIGLPQTLLRLTPEHEVAVLELGMNLPGELERLTEIAHPNVAGLTRIGRAHLGQFDSFEALIEAKLSLFEASPPGTPFVVNAGCENSIRAIDRFAASHPITTFRGDGRGGADCFIENVDRISPIGYTFDLVTPDGRIEHLELRHFGRHMVENVAAAAAFLSAAGFNPEWVADAVENFETEPLRGQVVEAGPWTFIMDCYNAAPDSMAGALNSLREMPRAGRTFIVLADMLELGEFSTAAHDSLLGPLRLLRPAFFFGLGPQMQRISEVLAEEGWEARGFDHASQLTDTLAAELRPGDCVLFKGSHAFALEKVAQAVAPDAPIMGELHDSG